MSKEMSTAEIVELNKEFAVGNAFTKWKFMQSDAYKKLPDAVRFTVEKECLTHYFNILTDGMPDWKLPITGTELSVIEQVDTNFKVFARGYYLMGTEDDVYDLI